MSRHALGDPRIPWTVFMTAWLSEPGDPELVRTRAGALAASQGWPTPAPLEAQASPGEVRLAADHRFLDGQAMLVALGRLLAVPVRSKAGGVAADRDRSSLLRSGAGRILEMVARPSAVMPPTATDSPGAEDAMAHLVLDRRVTTSALVVAATLVLSRRVEGPISVAVGVARPAEDGQLGDNSGFLRFRDARGLSREEVSAFLRTAPLQAGGESAPGVLGRIAGAVTSRLADRLGSTVLVSHLGDVEADGVTDLAFYPVSGGASGLSLGAATLRGRTTITLRARGHQHSTAGLQELLEAIAAQLRV